VTANLLELLWRAGEERLWLGHCGGLAPGNAQAFDEAAELLREGKESHSG
jgi:hypothetical protein